MLGGLSTCHTRAQPARWPAAFARLSRPLLPLALALLAACQTAAPQFPPFDLAAPGWKIQRVEAAWKPASNQPSLAGELLLAFHPNGQGLIEFTKAGLAVVTFRQTPAGWRLDVPARGMQRGGAGIPPARTAWFALADHLTGRPTPQPWLLTHPEPHRLQLRHPRTGEQLDLWLAPVP